VLARGRAVAEAHQPRYRLAAARRFGAMRGRARVDDAFFEPLPESELAAWE